MNAGQISGQIIDGLFVITLLAAVVLIVLAARRRRIRITDVSNGTGRGELNEAMADASTAFRLAVGTELERVRRIVRGYHAKVRNAPDGRYALEFPEMKGALIADQDSTLSSLLASLEEGPGPTRGLGVQVQAVAQLVMRSRGATVTATLHRPERHHDLLALVVEVVSAASGFARSRLLPEAGPASGQQELTDRIGALAQAGARCAAIDLVAWGLQRPVRFRGPVRTRRREGLALNLTGQLMTDSAGAFPPFAECFLKFAEGELSAATDRLPAEYQLHFNLAGTREAAGERAVDSRIRHGRFAAAVREYRAAARAAAALPEPARGAVQRTIRIRLTRAELVSGVTRLRQEALRWLREQRLQVALDCRTGSPGRRWAGRPGTGEAGIVLDSLTADYLYNSACTYAIAASITGRADWDHHARRLLGTALVVGTAEADLWWRAARDTDLRQLSWHLAAFLEMLRAALPDGSPDDIPLPEIVQLVDDVSIAAGWHARPALPRAAQ
jgi:hypothetical protein